MGRESSVGIETRYGLDGPGIESFLAGEIYHNRPYRPWGAPNLLYNGYRVFPGGKAAGMWLWPPTPSSAKVKERAQLYLYSPSGLSWPILGWYLPLPLQLVIWVDNKSGFNLNFVFTIPGCFLNSIKLVNFSQIHPLLQCIICMYLHINSVINTTINRWYHYVIYITVQYIVIPSVNCCVYDRIYM